MYFSAKTIVKKQQKKTISQFFEPLLWNYHFLSGLGFYLRAKSFGAVVSRKTLYQSNIQ